jgi:hypothetical protein
MTTTRNESPAISADEARQIAESVTETMLGRAFDPQRTDDAAGAEAATFMLRMNREGLLIAPLSDAEHAVAPPSMVDPAVAEAADAVLVTSDEIVDIVSRKLAEIPPVVAENAIRGLSLQDQAPRGLIVGCSCCQPRARESVA